MSLMYSTPSRIQTVYSANNSPKLAFPYLPRHRQFTGNPIFYSPSPAQTLPTLKTPRNPSVPSIMNPSENSRFPTQSVEPREDFSLREDKYVKTIKFLRDKMDDLLKENENLNQMVRKYQSGGVQLHNSTEELENQINYLIRENERLGNVCQNSQFYKELEAFNEEKTLCQAKIDELHDKLTLIFEDNDKLSSVLREREEDFENLQRIYERECRMRVDIEKKYEGLVAKKDFNGENLELEHENNRLRDFLEEQQRISKNLEEKVEILIQENEKLNSGFYQKVEQIKYLNDSVNELSSANKSLNEDNLKLTQILTFKVRELEEIHGRSQNFGNEVEQIRHTVAAKDEVIGDLERKVEILLGENGKLHGIIEEKLKDLENNEGMKEKYLVVVDEKNKLQVMLTQKNNAELYWRKKFEEIEGKIKLLFFQTDNKII